MTEKCVSCGRFVSYKEMDKGASFHFIPDNEFGPEESEWTCTRCVKEDGANHENHS